MGGWLRSDPPWWSADARVAATGGAVDTLTERSGRETIHGYLRLLPGGTMAVLQVW